MVEGDQPGAITDLQQAAQLAKQTNEKDLYQQAKTLLNKLRAKPDSARIPLSSVLLRNISPCP
jgi:DNA polymerase III delta prime subunit